MVNSAVQAGDFANFPFVDWQETVSRTPVTKTTTIHGDESFSNGTPANVDVVFFEVPRNSRFWNDKGFTKSADGIIYVLPAQALNREDKITVNSKTYRVGEVTTRYAGATAFYKTAQTFIISE